MTTAWVFGGTDILWEGNSIGTFDGNGQLWYISSLIKRFSNLPRDNNLFEILSLLGMI